VAATVHGPFVRDFTGFDRPWARLAEHLTDKRIQEIEMGCGYLISGRTHGSTSDAPPSHASA
jgi:hypothetical protein